MARPFVGAALTLVLSAPVALVTHQDDAPVRKQLIAHRGASGYAPEHTLPAYRLSLDYDVDFVEPDLAISKDGVLVCLHDETLDRTTDVEQVYPDRFSREMKGRRWVANDFTLEEIARLDAGNWMDARFAGTRVPTWDEMLALVRGRAGVYPELKSPRFYADRGVDMVKIFADSVRRHRLDQPDSLKSTPVIVQSFDETAVRRLAVELPTIPRVFLTSSDRDVTDARLRELATFATGIAPDKRVIARHPDMVARAHALGLTVTSWTFRADEKTDYPTVRDEMAQYLYTWGIDALFTNHPDQFPRR
jgi:glycerophosphoryl diester phosphodiesterase